MRISLDNVSGEAGVLTNVENFCARLHENLPIEVSHE